MGYVTHPCTSHVFSSWLMWRNFFTGQRFVHLVGRVRFVGAARIILFSRSRPQSWLHVSCRNEHGRCSYVDKQITWHYVSAAGNANMTGACGMCTASPAAQMASATSTGREGTIFGTRHEQLPCKLRSAGARSLDLSSPPTAHRFHFAAMAKLLTKSRAYPPTRCLSNQRAMATRLARTCY
jgi:hypothetical protein